MTTSHEPPSDDKGRKPRKRQVRRRKRPVDESVSAYGEVTGWETSAEFGCGRIDIPKPAEPEPKRV